jgi:hypothetical protein
VEVGGNKVEVSDNESESSTTSIIIFTHAC